MAWGASSATISPSALACGDATDAAPLHVIPTSYTGVYNIVLIGSSYSYSITAQYYVSIL